jgi:hypothetical protein
MSRKIKLTEADIDAMCIEFKNNLLGMRFDSEKITYTANTKLENKNKVQVLFRPEAYCKMTTLIKSCDKEIAWHGIVDRLENGAYLISDIMMYPQEITGATVTSNDEKYPMWLMQQPDEIFNRIRFQGHSHVNFGATPSGVDTTLYNNMLQTLSEDDFYIFFIMNKKAEYWIQIYNLAENTVYEKDDIELAILLQSGETMDTWYDTQTAENIIEKKVTYSVPTVTKTKTTPYSKYTDKTWRWDYVRKRHVPVGATEAELKEVYKRAKQYSKGKSEYEEYLDIELEDLHDAICGIADLEEIAYKGIADEIVSDQIKLWNDYTGR